MAEEVGDTIAGIIVRIFDWISTKVHAILLSRTYRDKYLLHITYRHRVFDVKGLTTQGTNTLELEKVFVDLSIARQPAHKIATGPVPSASRGPDHKRHTIWDYLGSDQLAGRNLVIIGAPGSGKTTLLKHIALALAGDKHNRDQKSMRDRLPILLSLRNHTEAIRAEPNITLVQILQRSLAKWEQQAAPGWFEAQLDKGNCLVMFDGLDEVADPQMRQEVVNWVERQMQMVSHVKNSFIVTSRPHGYQEGQLGGVTMLEVRHFDRDQVKRFVHNWYTANEVMSSQKDDRGVQMRAQEGAEDLLGRIFNTPALTMMAVNPLLLTMIATIHRYRSELPGRRVELYNEICDVFLGKRQSAKGLSSELTPAQKRRVLQPLALHMMSHQQREISLADALDVITDRLALVSPDESGEEFLKMIENTSGLLLEQHNGFYGFAHLTFQEYLAAVEIKTEGKVAFLTDHVSDSWWHETILLYCAQSDATAVIVACLTGGLIGSIPSAAMLALGIECLNEAQEVAPGLQNNLESFLSQMIDDANLEHQRVVADALLTLRLRHRVRIDEDRAIIRFAITNSDYQLFLDQQQSQQIYRQPDHWLDHRFPVSQGDEPIVGVRPSDAIAFCEWLTQREPETSQWRYRLPRVDELDGESEVDNSQAKAYFGHWTISNDEAIVYQSITAFQPIITHAQLTERLQRDAKLLKDAAAADESQFRSFITYLARALEVKPDQMSVLIRHLKDDVDRVMDRAPGNDFVNAINRTHSLNFDHMLDNSLTQDSIFSRLLTVALEHAIDSANQLGNAIDQIQVVDAGLARTRNLAKVYTVVNLFTDVLTQVNVAYHGEGISHTLALVDALDTARNYTNELEHLLSEASARVEALAGKAASDKDRLQEVAKSLGLDLARTEFLRRELKQNQPRVQSIMRAFTNALNRIRPLNHALQEANTFAYPQALVKTIMRAREIALNRKLAHDNNPKVKALTPLLRWCVRYCAFTLITQFLEQPQKLINPSLLQSKDVADEIRKMRSILLDSYMHFAVLEERINNGVSAREGVRIVRDYGGEPIRG